jgi:hypothetical protein
MNNVPGMWISMGGYGRSNGTSEGSLHSVFFSRITWRLSIVEYELTAESVYYSSNVGLFPL